MESDIENGIISFVKSIQKDKRNATIFGIIPLEDKFNI